MKRPAPPHDWGKARKLRHQMSLPEVLLWKLLKGQPQGIKFRRQHLVGLYVLDFYSPAAKLGLEIDGKSHDAGNRPERDSRRDGWLHEQGIEVIRVPAAEVLRSATSVAEAMLAEVRKRT